MKNEEIYMVTDGCMWEQNKQNSTYYPHAIEVVNIKTGQVQYIKSGSRIAFLEGEITITRDQKTYNKTTSEMSNDTKDKLQRTKRKNGSRRNVKKSSEDKSL